MSKNEENKELWKELVISIKESADKQNILQSTIAEHINVNPSTVSRILDMKSCPKVNVLFKMAEAVNIKIKFKGGSNY